MPMNPRLLRPRAAYAVRYPVRAVHVGGAVRVGPANTVVSPTTNVGGTFGDLMALATVQSGSTVTVDLSAGFAGQTVNYASLEIVLVDANSRIVGWGNTRTGYPDDGAGNPPTNGVGGLYLTLTISQFPQIIGDWVLNGKNPIYSGVASYAWLPVSPYKIVNTALIIEPTPAAFLSPSTSGWTGVGSAANKLTRATLTNIGATTITVNNAGLLRFTATSSGAGDGTGGLLTIVAGGQTFTGNSGGSGGSWTVDITKTVTVNQTITFASEYADGTLNNIQAWVISPVAPPAPTSLTSPSQSSGSVFLTWAAPANDGGSAITGYSVRYTPSGGSPTTVSTGSASTSYTLAGLTNGTSYTASVAAINSVGTGTYSSTTTATPTAGNSLTATGYSGAGTSASKLAPPASPATFTSSPTITVNTSGTLTVSIVSDDSYNDGWEVIVRRNGTAVYQNDGNAANGTTFTVAVTAGQTIDLQISGGGARWFASTRLWVA